VSDTIIAAIIGAGATFGAVYVAYRLSKRDTHAPPINPPQTQMPRTVRPLDPTRVARQQPSAPSVMLHTAPDDAPMPLDLSRVVRNPLLASRIADALASADQTARLGGITIGLPSRPRALIYVGPCPVGLDRTVRDIAKDAGFQVSSVRDLKGLGGVATATATEPRGY
jgi:hypothetical protein